MWCPQKLNSFLVNATFRFGLKFPLIWHPDRFYKFFKFSIIHISISLFVVLKFVNFRNCTLYWGFVWIVFNLIRHMDFCNFFTILTSSHFCLPHPYFGRGSISEIVGVCMDTPNFTKLGWYIQMLSWGGYNLLKLPQIGRRLS